jgi:hypothetical protein
MLPTAKRRHVDDTRRSQVADNYVHYSRQVHIQRAIGTDGAALSKRLSLAQLRPTEWTYVEDVNTTNESDLQRKRMSQQKHVASLWQQAVHPVGVGGFCFASRVHGGSQTRSISVPRTTQVRGLRDMVAQVRRQLQQVVCLKQDQLNLADTYDVLTADKRNSTDCPGERFFQLAFRLLDRYDGAL